MYLRFPAFIVGSIASVAGLLVGHGWVVVTTLAALALMGIDALAALSPKRVIVSRECPHLCRQGESVEATLTVRGEGLRRPVMVDVRDGWAPSMTVEPSRHSGVIAPDQPLHLSTTYTPSMRGKATGGPVTIRTRGPLGLAGRQRSVEVPAVLTVLPPFRSRKHLPGRLEQLRAMEGHSLMLQHGEGTEFDSLREYVHGDDVRAIDWRSTARRATVVVRTWRPERDRRITMVLDAGRIGAVRVGDAPRFDSYIETTLLMAALAGQSGDQLDIVAVDSGLVDAVVDHPSTTILEEAAARLASIYPSLRETNWDRAREYAESTGSTRGLVVLMTSISMSSIPMGFFEVAADLAKRHAVVIGDITDDDAAPNTPTQPAHPIANRHSSGHTSVFDTIEERSTEMKNEALARWLAGAGVHVVRATPETIAPRIADTYLELKSQGKL